MGLNPKETVLLYEYEMAQISNNKFILSCISFSKILIQINHFDNFAD